jgi:SAM-dependent methyltransferase
VRQAAEHGGFSTAVGDARTLDEPDDSYDAALLFGPLYHLVRREDRLQALTEARRVTRPGGLVAGAAISRYASTLDGFFRHYLDKPGFASLLREDLRSGQHRNPTADPALFTTAYFHQSGVLAAEVADSGLHLERVLPVEGPLHWAPDIHRRLTDSYQRALILDVLATIETDPSMASATAHILAIARS